MKTESEPGAMWPQAKDTRDHRKLEQAGRAPHSFQREPSPADTLLSDIRPPHRDRSHSQAPSLQ